ncbi:MAG: hypothetical protein ABH952_11160 [Candidatus Omnitrophota bacterium]
MVKLGTHRTTERVRDLETLHLICYAPEFHPTTEKGMDKIIPGLPAGITVLLSSSSVVKYLTETKRKKRGNYYE